MYHNRHSNKEYPHFRLHYPTLTCERQKKEIRNIHILNAF